MKKSFYLLGAVAITLASCADDGLLENSVAGFTKSETGEITFSYELPSSTRAEYQGADAAKMLNNQFVVGGYKGTGNSVVTLPVFDHYNVKWVSNTAGTTESNTHDWEYVGVEKNSLSSIGTTQTIKYWDYAMNQYDFIAYSTSDATVVNPGETDQYLSSSNIQVSKFTPNTATSASGGAYTVKGTTELLKKFFIADLVTVNNGGFGTVVNIKFRNITSKVRIGLYETIPGYSVRDVEFYDSNDAVAYTYTAAETQPTGTLTQDYYSTDGTIYASGTTVPATDAPTYYNRTSNASANSTLYSSTSNIYTEGTYTVYFPTTNSMAGTSGYQASDLNKAHVSFAAISGGTSKTATFGNLFYTRTQESTKESDAKYLGEASNNATYKTENKKDAYVSVLPNEEATALTLRVNYTLVSNDGSKETIKVWGAKAVVPAIYCQWKPNYAYTYLFKISDMTNGTTDKLGGSTIGLHPITFDAVVVDSEDGIQETITTVAIPSITTYQKGVVVTEKEEYKSDEKIYVMVQEGANEEGDLNTRGQLYLVETQSGSATISEATVMDALVMQNSNESNVITGRNLLKLTATTSNTQNVAIPGVNGNAIAMTDGHAAELTVTAGKSYAYVYRTNETEDTTGTTKSGYKENNNIADGEDVTSYYIFKNGAYVQATGTKASGVQYYEKVDYKMYSNTYAVKVIKVVN